MTKRLNFWLLALIVIIGVPYYWLLIDDRPGNVEPHPLSIAQLRELADSQPGARPVSISYEVVAARLLPRTLFAAGQGIRLERFNARAYRLGIPDGPAIMIDSGMSQSAAKQRGLKSYSAKSQALIDEELKKARLVITLSDDELHSGGLARAGLEQPPGQRPGSADCPKPQALAPGVVEIPVCGKIVSTRMVYVRLAEGREFLLAGDIAPLTANLKWNAGPSRLINDFYVRQDASEIHSWLLTISKLKEQAPNLIVIAGHSPLQGKEMRRGFRLDETNR